MKKLIFSVALLAMSVFCFAENYQQLLVQAEQNTSFAGTDFRADYSVVQDKPGEGKTVNEAIMYRRDSNGKWTILITGPASEKGKGYLQFDGNIWFYDPEDGRFTFTSAKDKFQDTNANNSDFAPQHYASSYDIQTAEEVKLGKFNCVLFSLKAKEKAKNVDYPVLKLWVSKDDGLVRKKEDYSASGQKLRTTIIPSYQSLTVGAKKYSVPVSMMIQDNLKGKKIGNKMQYEKTQVTISNVVFEKLKDSVYTKPYLEMMSQR